MKERRGKPYACVDVDVPTHRRFQSNSDPAGAFGLWTAMLCYAREQETDGLVPKRYAESLWGDRRNPKRLKEMCANDLLADRGADYEILRYAPRNQTKAMITQAKGQARDRMAELRKKRPQSSGEVRANKTACSGEQAANERRTNAFVPTSISPPLSGPISLVTEIESDPVIAGADSGPDEAPSEVRLSVRPKTFAETTDDGLSSMGIDNWRSGIRSVTGASFFPDPRGADRLELIACLRAVKPEGADPSTWPFDEGAAYARAKAGGALSAHWYCEWVGSGRGRRGLTGSLAKVVSQYDGEQRLWNTEGLAK
jgi:hypothetical protein